MKNKTLESATTFIYRNARPLDLARFQYHFENGSKEAVMNALSYYQNEDGGFGHAIEADNWNINSNPLHVSTACDIIREIDYEDASHPVIQNLLRWCCSKEHFNGKFWNLVIDSNSDYPHAPWWQPSSNSTCHTDYNGTAQIAGFIIRYAKPESEIFKLGVRVANEAIEALDENLNDMHTVTCYIHLKELIEKSNNQNLVPFDELKEKLHILINKLITSDLSKWNGYICKPSNFIYSNQSEFYEENKETSDYECTHIIDTQLEDGSWPVPWGWNDYEEEWHISKNWWKSSIIIQNLLYLKGFKKI